MARHSDRDVRIGAAETDRHPRPRMLTLVGLHVLAGLYHYFIRRDRLLQRILPGG